MPARRLPWFKLWPEAMRHEKIVLLSDGAFRTWIMMLAAGSEQAIRWRFASVKHAVSVTGRPSKHIRELVSARLIDEVASGELWVHDWRQWQDRYESDFEQRTLPEDSAIAPRTLRPEERGEKKKKEKEKDTSPQPPPPCGGGAAANAAGGIQDDEGASSMAEGDEGATGGESTETHVIDAGPSGQNLPRGRRARVNGHATAPSGPADPEAEAIWGRALDDLRGCMSTPNFESYLAETVGLAFAGDELVIGVRNPLVRDTLDQRFRPTILRSLFDVVGRECRVSLVSPAPAPVGSSP